MPRWKIWDRKTQEPPEDEPQPSTAPPVAPHARGFQAPRPRAETVVEASPIDDKLARLLRRREAVLFDVEQSELATQPDNPWRERIALLDDALANVASDQKALAALPVRPGMPLPPEPIRDLQITSETPITIQFWIGDERFSYEEEIDWAERGTQIAQPELVMREGDAANLIPAGFPEERRQELIEHLTASLYVFAIDLRDRALNDRALLEHQTLADLARPCEACGGWQDIHGMCGECQRRLWRRQELEAEAERLRSEREQEEAERARAADRLPVARRRLAEVDAEISAVSTR
jgi:hypothetical protein